MPIDAEQILFGINGKNALAWESVYDAYYAALCVYADRLIRDAVVAEDLVQDVLCSIWRSNRKFKKLDDFTFYLYRAVYNQAMMYIRSQKCHELHIRKIVKENEEFSEEIFAATVREELLRQLYYYIDELPEDRRKILLLALKGYSGHEIAEQLGITIHTVKTQKNRSFKFLREKLKGIHSVLFVNVLYVKSIKIIVFLVIPNCISCIFSM